MANVARKKSYREREISLTTSSTLTTYTARTGGPGDSFMADTFIRVTSTSGNSMTITLGDGVEYGQLCTVLFEVEASAETVDVSTTTGDDATQMTGAGGYSVLMWHGSTLGWAQVMNSAT